MNIKYNYLTTMYEHILFQMYLFLVLFTIFAFYHEKDFKQKLQKILFYEKYVHLGENTFIHCSRITVVHIHVNVFFSIIHPAWHSDANGDKPGSNKKMTDLSMLLSTQKLYVGT